MKWNKRTEPISERLRDEKQLSILCEMNPGIYNPNTKQSAIISQIYVVDPEAHGFEDDFSNYDEDRWIEYVTDDGPREDYSIDLDDEGWLWLDELKQTEITK